MSAPTRPRCVYTVAGVGGLASGASTYVEGMGRGACGSLVLNHLPLVSVTF